MGKVTESIFDGKTVIIPMADVQHIQKINGGISIITKHTTWNYKAIGWENDIFISNKDGEDKQFLKAWCKYRSEIESLDKPDSLSDEELSEGPCIHCGGQTRKKDAYGSFNHNDFSDCRPYEG